MFAGGALRFIIEQTHLQFQREKIFMCLKTFYQEVWVCGVESSGSVVFELEKLLFTTLIRKSSQ
jgi:hypothetical protein